MFAHLADFFGGDGFVVAEICLGIIGNISNFLVDAGLPLFPAVCHEVLGVGKSKELVVDEGVLATAQF